MVLILYGDDDDLQVMCHDGGAAPYIIHFHVEMLSLKVYSGVRLLTRARQICEF